MPAALRTGRALFPSRARPAAHCVAARARVGPQAVPGDRPEVLDSAAALLTVTQAKGLEFDREVLADLAGTIAQSPNGGRDLYVAITRAIHRLKVIHEGDLPPRCARWRPGRCRPPRVSTPREAGGTAANTFRLSRPGRRWCRARRRRTQ
jgi:hypothetical protein